jgi:hypothetical protein
MADVTRSAGTLIGAVLESTGYHYQDHILNELATSFAGELGGLIYLIGVCIAVVYAATQGSYKMAPWLLIGPPLFFAVVQVRMEIPNARWQVGLSERPKENVDDGVKEVVNTEAQANVSKVFARYIEMVSTSVNHIVATINKGRESTDLWFVLKAELYALMHTAGADEVGLKRLIHHSLYIDCQDVLRWGRMVNDPLFRLAGANDPKGDKYENSPEAQQAKDFFLPSQQYAKAKYEEHYKDAKVNLSDATADYVSSITGTPAEEIRGKAYSCAEVWDFTIKGILRDSDRRFDKLVRKAVHHGIDKENVENMFAQVSGIPVGQPIVYDKSNTIDTGQGGAKPIVEAGQAERIGRIISKYYLRNETGRNDKGSWIAYMANRHESRTLKIRTQDQGAYTEEARISVREWSEKERLMHSAASLPYYQGLALYFLGIFFPFFALLLLVPGKYGGFMQWFLLWLWVKSWDIGLAVVMLLDDMFFVLFAVERQEAGIIEELSDNAQADLGVAIGSLREMDPTFQLGTYYSIIAVCILAIPPTMAQLVMGSVKSGTLLISKGMDQLSGIYAEAAMSHDTRSAMQTLRGDQSALTQERAKGYAHFFRTGQSLASQSGAKGKGPGGGGKAPVPSIAGSGGTTGGGGVGSGRSAAAGGSGAGGSGGSKGGGNSRGKGGGKPGARSGGKPSGRGGRNSGLRAGNNGFITSQSNKEISSNIQGPTIQSQEGRRATIEDAGEHSAILNALSGSKNATGMQASGFNLVSGTLAALAGKHKFDAVFDANMAESEAEKRYLSAAAAWHEDISDRRFEIMERVAIYGGIPIPWSNFAFDTSKTELDLAIEKTHSRVRLELARVNEFKDYGKALQEAVKKVMPSSNPRSAEDVNKLYMENPGLRNKVREYMFSPAALRSTSALGVLGVLKASGEELMPKMEDFTRLRDSTNAFLKQVEEQREAWTRSPNGPDQYKVDLAPNMPVLVKRLAHVRANDDLGSVKDGAAAGSGEGSEREISTGFYPGR